MFVTYANGVIIIHLLVDLENLCVKNYLREQNHNDNLIIMTCHVGQTLGQATCSDFQISLTYSFLIGLVEDKNGKILAKILMKHSKS